MHVPSYGSELRSIRDFGCIPDGAIGGVQRNSERTRAGLEILRRASARVGTAQRSTDAKRASSRPTSSSHFLHLADNRRAASAIDRAFGKGGRAKRVSLYATSSFENGPRIRRQRRRLPGE